MTVRLLAATELDVAASLLGNGRIVGIPTDTVYGLAARLADDHAVRGLFTAKRRPEGIPIAVLCATADDAADVAAPWSVPADRLASRFWPGALTIVVDAPRPLSARLGATQGVGVRVPADDLCRALLGRTGPLAVTSANQHGEAPAATAVEVAAWFADDGVDAVLDGGPRDGVVSTVVDLTGSTPVVLREGALTAAVVLGALSEA